MKWYKRGDENVTTTVLSGSSKERRKRLREIRRLCLQRYPDAVVTVHAPIVLKDLGGVIGRVETEEANAPRTEVRITTRGEPWQHGQK